MRVRRTPARRRATAVVATLAASGLLATLALPAFATDVLQGESAFAATVESDEQRLTVGKGVDIAPAAVERWLLSRPVPAWLAPVPGELRDGFGPRIAPVPGASAMHRGQDLGASCGQRVRAASDGVVVQAGWFGTYGNWVMLDHGNGIRTGYAHNTSVTVRVGDRVAAGQVIAIAGTTGASSGCHVHLEVREGSTAVDPQRFMQARGAALGRRDPLPISP